MTELLEAVAALESIAAGDMSRESMIALANEVLGNTEPVRCSNCGCDLESIDSDGGICCDCDD